jgi:antagonist of KipI
MLTTVQDCGRWGFQADGVPVSGAMDLFSHRLANALVGNQEEAATLEVTLIGPEIEFQEATTVAVAGAVFGLALDGVPVAINRAFDVAAGSRLRFGERLKGARAYVAVAGGIDVPVVLGSRATHLLTKMGGFEGRSLRRGDVLKSGSGPTAGRVIGSALRLPDGGAKLRVIPSPDGFGLVASTRYIVSPRSDRMGYRLEGHASPDRPTGTVISAAVPSGAIQVTPTGQPILLMADHATTGGYAVAATVITADLPLAGQLMPGDWVEFRPCSLAEADAARRDQEAALGCLQ